MASIATCPGCTAQLAIPESAAADSLVLCPECAVEFVLSETIQLNLPRAKILSPREKTSPAVEELPSGGLAQDAPLASWEARLKNAISAEPDQEYETNCDEKMEPNSIVAQGVEDNKNMPEESELDSQQVGYETYEPFFDGGSTCKDVSQSELPGYEVPAMSLNEPAKLEQSAQVNPSVASPVATEITDSTPSPETFVPENVPSVNGLQRPRRRWRTVAATMIAGPLVGTFLGFYGLIWIRGSEADYLQMSRFLPSALYPASLKEDSQVEGMDSFGSGDPHLGLVESNHLSPSLSVRLDAQVQPVAVQQPVRKDDISAQDFRQLVINAGAVLPEFHKQNPGQNGGFQQLAQAYMIVCRLAEKFAFIHQLGLAPQAQQQIEKAKSLFQQVAADESMLKDLTYIASRWWQYKERNNQGIFFVGEIANVQVIGSKTVCQVLLPGNPGIEIPVVFENFKFRFRRGEQIAVVGNIERKPQQPAAENRPLVISQYSFVLR